MTQEKFVEICVDEGMTEAEAMAAFNAVPKHLQLHLTEESVRSYSVNAVFDKYFESLLS